MIFEILGKPPAYLITTLKEIIKKLGEEPGVEIKMQKIQEPAPLKDNKELYTTFAEIEIEVDLLPKMVAIMFKYMPAHVEIFEPENLQISNNHLNEVFNELARRLHKYDEVARILQAEKKILEKKLKDMMDKKEVKKD
jgi:predicted transcriptional regulator